jgi:hypothetical protein
MPDEQQNLTTSERISQALERDDVHASVKLVKELRLALVSTSDETQRLALERVIARLQACALKFTGDDTLVELFERYPVEVLSASSQFNLLDKLRSRLSEEAYVEDRNALRDRIRTALERSDESIGSDSIGFVER